MDVCLHPGLNQIQERTVSPGYREKQSSGDAACIYYLRIHLHGTPYVYFLDFVTIKMRGAGLPWWHSG